MKSMSWKRYRVVPVERGFIVERKLYHFSDYEPMRDEDGKIVNHNTRQEAVFKIVDYKNIEREQELDRAFDRNYQGSDPFYP